MVLDFGCWYQLALRQTTPVYTDPNLSLISLGREENIGLQSHAGLECVRISPEISYKM